MPILCPQPQECDKKDCVAMQPKLTVIMEESGLWKPVVLRVGVWGHSVFDLYPIWFSRFAASMRPMMGVQGFFSPPLEG